MSIRPRPVVTAFAVSILFGAGAGYFFAEFSKLPSLKALEDYAPPVVTKIYSDDGRVIGELFREKREMLSYEQLPKNAVNAVLAAEDSHFWSHKGVRALSLFRALVADIRAGRLVQGGSTITQQLAKSIFLTPEKTFSRKVKELMIALQLELLYTKSEILTFYFNQIYFGSGAYGLEAAAQVYFGRHAADLSLAQSAVIGALPRAPSRYSPYVDMARARARRSLVLKRMRDEGFITEVLRAEADVEPIQLAWKESPEYGPYFVEMVRQSLEEKYGSDGIYRQGLEVRTTLNIEMQLAAAQALARGIRDTEERINKRGGNPEGLPLQGALIAIDPATGHVKAMVGGRDFAVSEFNRAVQARRQPGSAFKPFVYAAALLNGKTPADMLIDSPTEVSDPGHPEGWKPGNYENRFYGPVTLRKALTHSLNVATVKLFLDVGPEKVIGFARRAGIGTELRPYPSLALGSAEVTLIDITSAYGVFAAGGLRAEPEMVVSVKSRGGPMDEYKPVVGEVMPEAEAFLMASMLRSVVEDGTGRAAKQLGRPAAGKTGTTDDYTDAWFVGFTPQLAAGVWVGYDVKKTLGEGESGGKVCAPIWTEFMKSALEGKPAMEFRKPDKIVEAAIDAKTGLLADPKCGPSLTEYFKEGTLPSRSCLDDR